MLPIGAVLEPIDNEYGTIAEENGKYWLTIKKIVSTEGREFECIHSGDERDILLPIILPRYAILRRGIDEALVKKGLCESGGCGD